MTDPADIDTPLDSKTDEMAEATRKLARDADPKEQEAEGSHGMPEDSPASDMARQHTNPRGGD